MEMPDALAFWELVFRQSDDFPDDDITVLASDGHQIGFAYHSDGKWHMENGSEWPGVIGWADLPDPEECVADLVKI